MIDKSLFLVGVCDKYPEELLEDSLAVEGTVCATLMKNLTLTDDSGLSPEDFITNDGRLLFHAIKELRDQSFVVFDEVTFVSHCSEKIKEIVMSQIGGFAKLQKMMDVVSEHNWDSYLDSLNKRNILLVLHRKNFNILHEMTLKDKRGNERKVVPIELFKKMTCAEVLEFYDATISDLGTRIKSSKVVDEGFIDFDDVWLKSLSDKKEVGVSFADAGVDLNGEVVSVFPFMDRQILGLLPGTLNCWGSYSGCGKSTYMVSIIMALISKGIKVILVTNEMNLSQYKTFFMLFVLTRYLNCWSITKRKIESGQFTEEERNGPIAEAQKLWRERFERYVRIECLEDSDNMLTCQIFKKWILKEGCQAFLVDTYKLSFDGNQKDNAWMDIVKDTRDLASLAAKYNVIGLMTVQLSQATSNRSYMDATCLSNCKAMKEVMTNLILFRKVTDEELDPNSPYYIKPFRSKQREDGTWYDEPFEPDRNESWRVALIDKSRRGPDSADLGGIGYLWKFKGDYGRFSETCKCRPTRKLLPGSV